MPSCRPTANIPSAAQSIGCFPDRKTGPVFTVTLSASDRTNSVDSCTALGRSWSTSNPGARVVFIGVRITACVGVGSLPSPFLLGQLPDSQCSAQCPGQRTQRCGAAPNATHTFLSVFRIL